MSSVTIHTSASSEAVREALAGLPQEATGGGTSGDALMERVGMALLGHIRRAFITKARGGTDEAGDRWAPLSPKTVARRRGGRPKTKGKGTFDKYGSCNVEILRDTGLLLNSLSPGVASAEKVFDVGPGEVIVGTNRAGAAAHHHGVPGRLPQRRLWPEVHSWPASWWLDIIEQARDGLVDVAVEAVRNAK